MRRLRERADVRALSRLERGALGAMGFLVGSTFGLVFALPGAVALAGRLAVTALLAALVYPELASSGPAVATVPAGRRRVRLALVGLPFGFRSSDHRDETIARRRQLLVG